MTQHTGLTTLSDQDTSSNSLFVMTALPFWWRTLVKYETDQKPGAAARRVENNAPLTWHAGALAVWQMRLCWVRAKHVMFDVVYQEGNVHCLKGRQLDRPSWLVMSREHTVCVAEVQLKAGVELDDCCATASSRHLARGGGSVSRWHPRRTVPSVFLFTVHAGRTFWQQQGWDTHTTLHQSMIVTPQEHYSAEC